MRAFATIMLLLLPMAVAGQGRPFQLEGLSGDTLGPGDFDQGRDHQPPANIDDLGTD